MAKRRQVSSVAARVSNAERQLRSEHFKRITKALAKNRGASGAAADIRKAMRRTFWYYYANQLITFGLLKKTGRDEYQLTEAGIKFARR